MKKTINVDVEKDLLTAAEEYAAQQKLSLSQLVESFFRQLTTPVSEKNIVQLVRELNKPTIEESKDLKQAYYQEQKAKHGF